MAKNKLVRWNELATFDKVIQPETGAVAGYDHPVRGNWKSSIFKNENPVVLELGCGKGEYTTGLAARFPERNFIGVDIKGARMWRGAKTANEQKLPNVAFLRTRIEFINSFFSNDEIDEIWITFPDPHPGGRNANKRLTSPWFLNCYRSFLKNNGLVHLKTDNTELFEYTRKIASGNNLHMTHCTSDLYSSDYHADNASLHNDDRLYENEDNNFPLSDILSIKTHYEKLFLDKGLKINYLSFKLANEKIIQDGHRKDQNKQ